MLRENESEEKQIAKNYREKLAGTMQLKTIMQKNCYCFPSYCFFQIIVFQLLNLTGFLHTEASLSHYNKNPICFFFGFPKLILTNGFCFGIFFATPANFSIYFDGFTQSVTNLPLYFTT